jgi:hypothetical protein
LLFLPAGVLDAWVTSAQAHLGGGQCLGRVRWRVVMGRTAGGERNPAREKKQDCVLDEWTRSG